MKKTFYWDTHVNCYDCRIEGENYFWTFNDDSEWDCHKAVLNSHLYTVGDVQVPDTCLILQQIPVDDENFL